MSIDLLVKLRDAHQMVADALNEEIEKNAPQEVKIQKPTEVQFNGLNWITKEGTRGNYQQIENDSSQEFKKLAEYVKSKGGFCNIYGFKTWLHNQDENVIDRKR